MTTTPEAEEAFKRLLAERGRQSMETPGGSIDVDMSDVSDRAKRLTMPELVHKIEIDRSVQAKMKGFRTKFRWLLGLQILSLVLIVALGILLGMLYVYAWDTRLVLNR